MLNRQQMELGLENTADKRPWRQRRRRTTRARWWFNRMHEVVDQTREWLPLEIETAGSDPGPWISARER
jgi:hypothetical protein